VFWEYSSHTEVLKIEDLKMEVSKKTLSVSHVIANSLYEFGATEVFCVVGGAIAPLSDVLAKDSRFNVHYLLHEQSAGIAAESYSATCGKPSVLLVTSGPGATNAITPVVAAWTNSTPMIVIAGQVRSIDVQKAGDNRQWGSQQIDSIAMVTGFTKLSRRLDQDSIQWHFPNDLKLATSGRPGPIWFEVSTDIQRSEARVIYSQRESKTTHFLDSEINSFINILIDAAKNSRRPLILLGNGCRTSLKEVLGFVRSMNWPVQLTWPALDFLTVDDPLYAGRPGGIATWGANVTLQNADFVLVLGARLDWGQVAFRPENFAPKARILRVEIDPEEIRRISSEKVIDACASISDFILAAKASNLESIVEEININSWRDQVSTWKQKLSNFGAKDPVDGLSMYRLLECISSSSFRFPTIVSGSSGTCTEQVMQAIAPQQGQRILNSGGLGSMGFGIAGAIGAYYATGEPVLCLESDGSFAMNPQDLAHIAQNKLPIRILIMDSLGYKSILLSQRRGEYELAGIDKSTGVSLLDPVSIAAAMGIEGKIVSIDNDWHDQVTKFLESDSPFLLRVIVSADEEAAPRVISKPNKEGRMETSMLEDLWPPMDEELYLELVQSWGQKN
jgi:acetolactate synthase I/II/III large subunit